MTRAVAYLRCSSDRQARQESSIPAQRAEIERRARADGAVVVQWFTDDGISGKNVEDRPGLQALLDYVATNRGTVATMYTYDGKRMARDRADAYAVRKALHRAGVRLVALAQPSVDDEAANAILESVWDGIAEAERIQLGKVVRRGQEQSLRDGWWPYRAAPFGFKIVAKDNSGSVRSCDTVRPRQRRAWQDRTTCNGGKYLWAFPPARAIDTCTFPPPAV